MSKVRLVVVVDDLQQATWLAEGVDGLSVDGMNDALSEGFNPGTVASQIRRQIERVRKCQHPQRILTLGGPGSFDCITCGYSVSTLSKGGCDV